MKKTIIVEGMSCNHCVKAVEEALKGIDGVSEVIVSLEEGSAVVELHEEVEEEVFHEVIDEAGYEVASIS